MPIDKHSFVLKEVISDERQFSSALMKYLRINILSEKRGFFSSQFGKLKVQTARHWPW